MFITYNVQMTKSWNIASHLGRTQVFKLSRMKHMHFLQPIKSSTEQDF